jgi:arsenate reductase
MAATNVLFVCGDNAAASIMAESVLRSAGGARFHAYSVGIRPAAQVHPSVLEFLHNRRLPVAGLRTKNWHELTLAGAPRLDFVITLCEQALDESPVACRETAVLAHWSLEDEVQALRQPATAGDAIRDAFWVLQRRIKILTNLPFGSVPRRSIQNRVEAIATWQ